MNDKGIRGWAVLGALVSVALLTPACDRQWPVEGSEYEGVANEGQKNETLSRPMVEQQGSQELGTGGSGFLQDGTPANIGAPGYSTPRDTLLPSGLPPEELPGDSDGSYHRRGDTDRIPVREIQERP